MNEKNATTNFQRITELDGLVISIVMFLAQLYVSGKKSEETMLGLATMFRKGWFRVFSEFFFFLLLLPLYGMKTLGL